MKAVRVLALLVGSNPRPSAPRDTNGQVGAGAKTGGRHRRMSGPKVVEYQVAAKALPWLAAGR